MTAESIGALAAGITNRLAEQTGRVKQFPEGTNAMNQVATISNDPSALLIESVIVKGDLSGLNVDERIAYYRRVCESIGLNPLTKPFEYLTLNSKLVLYARRDATDQLRKVHNVSVTDMTEAERDGVFCVTVKVQNALGRTDMAKGAVNIASLKGEALANAMMKAETKAKRRATLSICGLGFLDETEIETIPEVALGNGAPVKRTREQISSEANRKRQDVRTVTDDILQLESLAQLERYEREEMTPEFMSSLGMKQYTVEQALETRRIELKKEAEADGPSKADYIRQCHEKIDAFESADDLLVWWNSDAEKQARRNYALNKDEVRELMPRVFERREALQRVSDAGQSDTAEPEERASEAPTPTEGGLDASEKWRDDSIAFFNGAKTLKAIDTYEEQNVAPVRGWHFPGDVGDVERAIERARKRVSA